MESSNFITDETLSPAQEAHYISLYLPLVKRIVKQLSWQTQSVIDSDDMEQIALMGLLSSLRRYGEPDEQFAAYAYARIRGSVLDELRMLDWRPRRMRQKAHKINDAIRELSRKLGRELNDEDILRHLDISQQEYQEYLLLENASALQSLDEILAMDGSIGHHSRPLEEEMIINDSLRAALATLDRREQLILTLYYQHELSLKEIALILEITEARVCQLNKGIVQKIKVAMAQ
ncbi:MAG: FliA/WhiG family RNA polymerase sigma factor [Silvania sp.]|uniref:FliA/WhiG family RNA polymerase sigma factor n=1 Tax=Silvania sp. TaxID=3016633 RepID=UPI003EE697B4